MKVRILHTVLLILFLTPIIKSQIVSQFNWNSNPVTTAVVGPNASSVGSSAISSTGGVGGTNGLNPGAPTMDINMHIPNTANVFDINNIDISIDYRRNESVATMFKRNTFSSNNGAANFRMTYRVATGTVVTTVTSSNVAIPQDNTFRNYRFTYDNCSGIGTMYVNNVVVWTSTATPNQNLYWASEGDLVIGQDMDGASNNIVNLDNFIMQRFTCSTLPIELISFSGINYGEKNILKWKTATETNNDYFTIEHSDDGYTWRDIQKVYGSGNSSSEKNYSISINKPDKTVNYYRLKQTDFDRQTKKFSTVVIDNSNSNEIRVVKTTDILGRDVPENFDGLKIIQFSDGSSFKLLDTQ